MEEKETTEKPQTPKDKEGEIEEKPTQKSVSPFVRNRRFYNLVTGGNINSYCSQCGGLCSNSAHQYGEEL